MTRQKKFRKAIEFLLEAKHTEGSRPEPWVLDYSLGKVYTKLNKTEDAVKSFLNAAVSAGETKSKLYENIRFFITATTAGNIISFIDGWLTGEGKGQLTAADSSAIAAIKDYALSLNSKQSMIKESPGDTAPASAALIKEVYVFIGQNNYKAALEKIEAALSKEPHNAEILFLKIRILVENQVDLKGAEALFNDAEFGYRREIDDEKLIHVLNGLAEKEAENGNTIFFVAFLANLMNYDATRIETWLNKVDVLGLKNANEFPLLGLYLLKGEVAEKKEDHTKAAAQYFEAAKCFYWQGNNTAANKYFEKCTSLDAGFNEAFFYNADTLFILSSLSEPPYNDAALLRQAQDCWNKAPKKTVSVPDDAWHYIVIARIHEINAKFVDQDFFIELWRSLLYAERVLVQQDNVASNWIFTSRFFRNLELEQNSFAAVEKADALDGSADAVKEEKILMQLNTGDFKNAMLSLQLLKDADDGSGNVYKAYHKSWEGYILYHNIATVAASILLFDAVIAEVKTDIFSRQMKMLGHWVLHDLAAAQKEAANILALLKQYDYRREEFIFSWASFIVGDTAGAINCLEMFNEKAGYPKFNAFSLLQFYLFAGQTTKAEEAFNALLAWNNNKNTLVQLVDNLAALSFQFSNQTAPALAETEFLGRVEAWLPKIREKIALLNTGSITAADELMLKQQEFGFEENSIPFIAIKAALARLCYNNNNQQQASQLYSSLLQYENDFPEAAIAANRIQQDINERAVVLIKDGQYANAIEYLQSFDMKEAGNLAVKNTLLSQAYYGNYKDEQSLAAIKSILVSGQGEKTRQQYWTLLAGEAYGENISWQFAKFIEANYSMLQDPALEATADDHFWKPMINKRKAVSKTDPLLIEISSDLILPGDPVKDWKVITHLIPAFRTKILDTFGIKLPSLLIRENTTLAQPGSFTILLDEIPVVSGNVYPDKLFVTGLDENPATAGIPGTPATEPLTGKKGLWVDKTYRDLLDKSNQPVQDDPYQYIMGVLETAIMPSLAIFVDAAFSGDYLFNFINENTGKDTIIAPAKRIQAEQFLFTRFSQLLKALIADKVSLKNKQAIITAFTDAVSVSTEINHILQQTRLALKNELPERRLQQVLLPAVAESLLKQSMLSVAGKTFLAMRFADCQQVMAEVQAIAGDEAAQQKQVLVVADPQLRMPVRKLLEVGFIGLAVATKEELTG